MLGDTVVAADAVSASVFSLSRSDKEKSKFWDASQDNASCAQKSQNFSFRTPACRQNQQPADNVRPSSAACGAIFRAEAPWIESLHVDAVAEKLNFSAAHRCPPAVPMSSLFWEKMQSEQVAAIFPIECKFVGKIHA